MSDERTLPCGCTEEEECSECSPWGAPIHDDRDPAAIGAPF